MDTEGILAQLTSHAKSLGVLRVVKKHEAKSAPPPNTVSIFFNRLQPAPNASGLAETSINLIWTIRVYGPFISDPSDTIDTDMLKVVDKLINAYSNDFELSGKVRNIDLFGAHGSPLTAVAGYLTIDNKLYRIIDISLPMIVNDVWSQVA